MKFLPRVINNWFDFAFTPTYVWRTVYSWVSVETHHWRLGQDSNPQPPAYECRRLNLPITDPAWWRVAGRNSKLHCILRYLKIDEILASGDQQLIWFLPLRMFTGTLTCFVITAEILDRTISMVQFPPEGEEDTLETAKKFLMKDGSSAPRYDHLLAIERAGRAEDGGYYTMRAIDVRELVGGIDWLFQAATDMTTVHTTGTYFPKPWVHTVFVV